MTKTLNRNKKHTTMTTSTTIFNIISYIILIVGSFAMIAPLVWMLSTALKEDQFSIYNTGLFSELYFDNFFKVFKTIPLVEGFKNSLIVAVPSIVIGSLVSAMAAYAFAKIDFKFKNILFLLLLGVIMIPFPVIMIPQYYIFTDLDWIGTLLPLIIPKMLGNIMMIFFLKQFMENIPNSLIESAKIDGANHFRIFLSVILPLVRPALAAQMILWFMGVWNDYLAPNLFSAATPTLPVVIASLVSFTDTRTETHLNMAASIISTVPVVVVFAIFQRQIIDSVMLSGSKE